MLRASGGMKNAGEYDLGCALHPAKTTARHAMRSNRDADVRKYITAGKKPKGPFAGSSFSGNGSGG
jgi:hypothetical protein